MQENQPINFSTPAGGILRQIVDVNDDPWFVAIDVCEGLGLTNVSEACSTLHEDEKDGISLPDIMGRNQRTLIVSEPGLYRLIGKSTKPEAEAFKRWIYHEVLPSIRKTGSYGVPQMSGPQIMAHALVLANEELTAMRAVSTKLNEEVTAWRGYGQEAAPFVEHSAQIQASRSLLTSESVAKDPRIGMRSGLALNQLLNEMGLIYKRGKRWHLYAKYTDRGYHGYQTYEVMVDDRETGGKVMKTFKHLRWTEKFLFELPGLISAHNLKIATGEIQ